VRRRGRRLSAFLLRLTGIFSAFSERILPVTREIADLWGDPLGQSEKNIDDAGLAATARVHSLVLVTRNTGMLQVEVPRHSIRSRRPPGSSGPGGPKWLCLDLRVDAASRGALGRIHGCG
jgi:hypothetical protein